MIQQALASARLAASEVDAVEAHGTGTSLGDPIEAQALLATYGQARDPARPLWLGSLKSNIGHPQAAAGVGGIIKVIKAMQHEVLPRTLHVCEPTPRVDWSTGAVRLLTESQPWPRGTAPRRAGVSAFGLSGTNAHVIIEEAPTTPPSDAPDAPAGRQDAERAMVAGVPLQVSARSKAALRAQAARLATRIDSDDQLRITDLGYSLAMSRAALERRASLVATDRAEAVRGLTALASGSAAAGLFTGIARADSRTAFIFSGQGTRHLGMGHELHRLFPAFADALDAVAVEFDSRLRQPLKDVMWGEDAAALDRTEYAHQAIFAVEVALYRLLESSAP